MSAFPRIDLAEVEKELCRRSLAHFARRAWPVLEPATPLKWGWALDAICEHLEAVTNGDIRRLLVNVPPGSMKSLLTGVIWPAWEWGPKNMPHIRYLGTAHKQDLAIRDNMKCRRLIQSDWYQKLWPIVLTGDQNAKTKFENAHTGFREAMAFTSMTGSRGDRVILDDPHSVDDANSAALLSAGVKTFREALPSRVNNDSSAIIIVMQRLHEADVSAEAIALGYDHLCIPMRYEEKRRPTSIGWVDPRSTPGELMFPDRFPEDQVVELERSLGSYATAGQLQQRPAPVGGGIIRTDNFQLWPASRPLPAFDYVLQSYDTAYSEKTTGDPSACTVWGVFTQPDGKRCCLLLDTWAEHLSYPDLRERVIRDWGEHYASDTKTNRRGRRADNILVEEKSSGISLLQDLRLAGVPAIAYNPGRSDKVAKVHQATPMLETGCFYLLESNKTPGNPVTWAQEFISQCEKFPNAAHDDMVDTWSQATIWLRDNGWLDLQVFEDDEPEDDVRPRRVINPYGA